MLDKDYEFLSFLVDIYESFTMRYLPSLKYVMSFLELHPN